MASGITITIGGTDLTSVIPFSNGPNGQSSWVTITETVPGTATATMRIYDLTNSVNVPRLASIVVYDKTNSRNVFQGIVQRRKFTVQATYRIIELSCVDLNTVLDTTLVGTPTGSTWVPDSTGSSYTCIDPSAYVNGGSDAANVQRLFSTYWQGPVAVDTSTYVTVTNGSIGYPDGITWNQTTLKQALDDVAALAGPYVTWWIDADAKLHWTAKPQTGAPSGGTNWSGGTGTYTYTTGNLLMLFPQTSYTINGGGAQPPVPPAPYNLSDEPDGVTSISYENFSVEYDDSGAADSLYANGATGFTYTPPATAPVPGIIETNPPGSSLPTESGVSSYGYYSAALSGSALAYPVDNSGVVEWNNPVTLTGSSYYVNPVSRTTSTSGGTGSFYEVKNTGTGNGYLLPSNTSGMTITPQTATASPGGATGGAGTYGIGATGWVNDAGPTWLSRYIQEPDASTQADRDAKGNVALQYMSQSIVRGAADVVYPGILYRAGMGLTITNHPVGLSGALYMIMRVTTTFLSGKDDRRATIEWGTAPLGNLGLRRQAQRKPPAKNGAMQHKVSVGNTSPMPGSTVTLYTQLVNRLGEPWAVQNKTVTWTVRVFDANGNEITSTSEYNALSNTGGWQLIPSNQSLTDASGGASVQLQLATTAGWQYQVAATSPD